ncbi:conserved uncharacterized protein, related to heparinase II/III [Desulfosarcina variabilis str. Montpellier]|uniref:heparinase II/III domain-containing protein n=1 Tax=Desulfosarcina variabilis TaxID=2300 RepID=UPI003AFA303D
MFLWQMIRHYNFQPSGFLLSMVKVLFSLLVGGFLLGNNVGLAQPRTLYRHMEIENAKQNLKRYSWAQKILSKWKNQVTFAMKKDRVFFEKLIPELTPGTHYGQTCPKCVGRQSLMGQARFNWKINKPDQVTCMNCGTVYPNEAYPETGVVECPRMGVSFTYYETPEEKANPETRAKHAYQWVNRPVMTSFSGLIRFRKVKWAWEQMLKLAKLYALTGEIAYAERAIWILNRFAQVYPNYLYHSYDGSVADWPPEKVSASMGEAEGPRGGRFPLGVVRHAYGLHQKKDYSTLNNGFWGAGRLNTHGKGSDVWPLLNMTIAFDLIRDAKYQDGRPLVDNDMKRSIINDLILAGCTDMEQWNSLSNKGVAVLSLSAAVGRLLEQPERVRRAIDGFNRMLEKRYHFDGFYGESPHYATHNFSNIRELLDLLYGYSDPPGYQPEEGKRLEKINPYKMEQFQLALLSLIRPLAPRQLMPVIGDTRYDKNKVSTLYSEILADRLGEKYSAMLETVQGASLTEKGNEYALWYRPADLKAENTETLPLCAEWFPGWHVGVLRGGREENDTALYLNGNENKWTIKTGHRHLDVLGLSYWAYSQELVSDRGYFSGSGYRLEDGRTGQHWMRSTLSHNLVVVDEKNQASKGCGSKLELFGVAAGIEVVQASGHNVYPQCSVYRRTTAQIRRPDWQNYAVDFFRVKGGKTHQYSFNCNGKLVSMNPAWLEFQPVTLAPVWSNWLNKAKAVRPQGAYTFTWRNEDINLGLTLLNTKDNVDRIIVADAPGWRVAKPSELKKPPIQQILAEHRASDAEDAITTQYASIIVPYKTDDSPVVAARMLKNNPDSGVLAVEVKLADRIDIIVSTRDQQQRDYGTVSASGEFSFVSIDSKGRATQGYLLNGTRLECGDLKIELAKPNVTVKVQSVEDRTFHLAEGLPQGVSVGSYILVEEPPTSFGRKNKARPITGFEIESTTANSITVRDYPAVKCDKVTVLNSKWVGESD